MIENLSQTFNQTQIIGPIPPGSNPNLPVIDCKLSPWGPWSTCSALCGSGKRLRSRFIVQMPQNGGKPCDKKLTRTQRCRGLPPCPPSDYQIQEQFSSHLDPGNKNNVKPGHKQNASSSKVPEWRTTSTTQGSSMLDDEDDSKFSRLLQTDSNSLQSSSFTSNVSLITDGTSTSDMELIGSTSFHIRNGYIYLVTSQHNNTFPAYAKSNAF